MDAPNYSTKNAARLSVCRFPSSTRFSRNSKLSDGEHTKKIVITTFFISSLVSTMGTACVLFFHRTVKCAHDDHDKGHFMTRKIKGTLFWRCFVCVRASLDRPITWSCALLIFTWLHSPIGFNNIAPTNNCAGQCKKKKCDKNAVCACRDRNGKLGFFCNRVFYW